MDTVLTGSVDTNSEDSDYQERGDRTFGVESSKQWLCWQGWPCPMTQKYHQEFFDRNYYAEQHASSSCPPFHWHTYFICVHFFCIYQRLCAFFEVCVFLQNGNDVMVCNVK